VNANPNDKQIENEFRKWTKANGKVLSGLVKRRQDESNYYFSI
jgi:lysozyme